MTNTFLHAQSELSILSQSNTDPENRPIVEPFADEILALCEKFGRSGQSGGSAPIVASVLANSIKKLLLQEPISPITGIDQEWVIVSSKGETALYQNIRCSALFKNDSGRAWYLDAIVKKAQTGMTYSGPFWLSRHDFLSNNRQNRFHCRQYVKSFPFVPKTFYIDVIEEEVAKDDWDMYVKDPKQLNRVWKYYDRY